MAILAKEEEREVNMALFRRMSPATLRRIADDLLGGDSSGDLPRGDLPRQLSEYCKAYRLNEADLHARYPELITRSPTR